MLDKMYNTISKYAHDLIVAALSTASITANTWEWINNHVTLNAIVAIITAGFTIVYVYWGIRVRKVNYKARMLECQEREIAILKEKESLKFVKKVNDDCEDNV